MAAAAVAIAKEVTAMLATAGGEDGDLVRKFTPERSYGEWDLDLTDLDVLEIRERDALRVDVVAHTTEQSARQSSRGTVRFVVPVDIAIRQRFSEDKLNADNGRIDIEAIDELMQLTQEIYLMFMPTRLTAFTEAVFDQESGGTKILAAPMKNHLRLLQQFTSIIRVHFRYELSIA